MKKNKNSYEEVLESEVAKLKEENRHLKDENKELKYMLNDMHSVVDAANDDFFNEMSRLCGCIEIEGTRNICTKTGFSRNPVGKWLYSRGYTTA